MKAKVTRTFIHGDEVHGKGDTIDIPAGQFADWKAVGLVEAEIVDDHASVEAGDVSPAKKVRSAKPE